MSSSDSTRPVGADPRPPGVDSTRPVVDRRGVDSTRPYARPVLDVDDQLGTTFGPVLVGVLDVLDALRP